MPHEPKRRHSRQRKGKRRAGIRLTVSKSVVCENCGSLHISHTVCENCGFYKGTQYVEPGKPKRQETA